MTRSNHRRVKFFFYILTVYLFSFHVHCIGGLLAFGVASLVKLGFCDLDPS
jgi:hypothetical protein